MRPTLTPGLRRTLRRGRQPDLHQLLPRQRRHRSRGQSLVELALILPVFLVLFATVLDLGRIAAARVAVTNAAREGAFQAAVTPTSFQAGAPCNQATNLVMCRTLLESTGSVVTISPTDVSLSCNPTCASGLGNAVTVTVTGHFQLLTPVMATFFGGNQSITFTTSSTTQIETLPDPPSTPTPTATPTPTPTATPTPTPTPTPACLPPSAGFTYTTSPASGHAPVTLTVTDTSTPSGTGCITSWAWDWGDGTFSSGQNPGPHVYVAPKKYYAVYLTVNGPAGTNTSGATLIWVK